MGFCGSDSYGSLWIIIIIIILLFACCFSGNDCGSNRSPGIW